MTPDIPDILKPELAEILNLFPEVRWDRIAGNEDRFTIFGWVDRPEDLRADFAALTVNVEGRGLFSYYMTTSSARHSEEFALRLATHNEHPRTDAHNPCQRVSDVFGDQVHRSVALSADPMDAGGDIAGPEDPHGYDTAVLSVERAVMVDGMGVAAMQLERSGQLEEMAIGLLLEGDINRSEPREHARVLNIMGLEEVAGLICELQAVAHRYSPGLAAELKRLLEKRWRELEAEGLTQP